MLARKCVISGWQNSRYNCVCYVTSHSNSKGCNIDGNEVVTKISDSSILFPTLYSENRTQDWSSEGTDQIESRRELVNYAPILIHEYSLIIHIAFTYVWKRVFLISSQCYIKASEYNFRNWLSNGNRRKDVCAVLETFLQFELSSRVKTTVKLKKHMLLKKNPPKFYSLKINIWLQTCRTV